MLAGFVIDFIYSLSFYKLKLNIFNLYINIFKNIIDIINLYYYYIIKGINKDIKHNKYSLKNLLLY